MLCSKMYWCRWTDRKPPSGLSRKPWRSRRLAAHFLYVANINQLAINACLSDAILSAVTKAGDVILERAMEKVPAGIEKEASSETGSPAVVILDYLEDHPMDLVIMGSRGLGVVKGVLLGSVSQYVVEQAKCPVLVVK